MPIQIGEVVVTPGQTPPEWARALSEQIARLASDVSAQTRQIDRLQQQVADLLALAAGWKP